MAKTKREEVKFLYKPDKKTLKGGNKIDLEPYLLKHSFSRINTKKKKPVGGQRG